MTCDGLTPALSVIPADRRTLSNWYVFVGPLVLAAISNVKTAEKLVKLQSFELSLAAQSYDPKSLPEAAAR